MTNSPGHQKQKDARSPAEWVSLAISSGIVAVLVAAIILLYFSGSAQEPIIEIRPGLDQVRSEPSGYYLPISINNVGGSTAENVIIEIALATSSGEEEVSEVTIGFLAGQASEAAVVVFSEDPRLGTLDTRVKSYVAP